MPSRAGISAISVYVPRHRVDLEQWCEWTGAPWPKVAAVVGRSFRVCGPDENAYTMAASAALRLIQTHAIDPRRIGFFALGTESSTDNAAGAVIVKGMVDAALRELGQPAIARDCEVPEFKHACLGGVYAMKAAARYLACDGDDRVAIVISSDIAEYERGSSGEQTQGAGAVAFLMEAEPKLLALDLARAGSASSYRGYDFRKPFARHFMPGYRSEGERVRDYPVFNGKYSTLCYIDEAIAALDRMFGRLGAERQAFYDELGAIFFHRPYHHLPTTALATARVWDLVRDEPGRARLAQLCEKVGVDFDRVVAEIERHAADDFDLFRVAREQGADHDPFAAANAVAKALRGSPEFKQFVADKMAHGNELVAQVGNLYTASLPAWLAAGLEDALGQGTDLAGKRVLLVGYGSGDAAEAIPAQVVPGWQQAAAGIGFARALEGGFDLSREQYEALHDGRHEDLGELPGTTAGFAIDEVGEANAAKFADIGIEYYAYVDPASRKRQRVA